MKMDTSEIKRGDVSRLAAKAPASKEDIAKLDEMGALEVNEDEGEGMTTGPGINLLKVGSGLPGREDLKKMEELKYWAKKDPGIWDRIAGLTNKHMTYLVMHPALAASNTRSADDLAVDEYLRHMNAMRTSPSSGTSPGGMFSGGPSHRAPSPAPYTPFRSSGLGMSGLGMSGLGSPRGGNTLKAPYATVSNLSNRIGSGHFGIGG